VHCSAKRVRHASAPGPEPDLQLPTWPSGVVCLPMLQQLNDVWLGGRDYVGGGAQPSVADLLLACEIEMLRLLDAADQVGELLLPRPA
jgi:hypothetical protein